MRKIYFSVGIFFINILKLTILKLETYIQKPEFQSSKSETFSMRISQSQMKMVTVLKTEQLVSPTKVYHLEYQKRKLIHTHSSNSDKYVDTCLHQRHDHIGTVVRDR